MATSFGALCTDFYVNVKLALKMDLPSERETVLHMFDRVRKVHPSMDRLKRYENELALESSRKETEQRWLSLRRTSLRTGHVNPQEMEDTYRYHRMVLELAPYHLTISPLDIDYLELLFGFDFECDGNHDEVVYEALYGDTPLGKLMQIPGENFDHAKIVDVQPILGAALSEDGKTQAFFEVKTRTRGRRGQTSRYREEPLSIFLMVRQYGPVNQIEDLLTSFDALKEKAEILATDQMVPHLLTPISRQIISSGAGGIGGTEV
jgi:hypothetical protein